MSSKCHRHDSKWDTMRIPSTSPNTTWPTTWPIMALFLPNHLFPVEVMSWLSDVLKSITTRLRSKGCRAMLR